MDPQDDKEEPEDHAVIVTFTFEGERSAGYTLDLTGALIASQLFAAAAHLEHIARGLLVQGDMIAAQEQAKTRKPSRILTADHMPKIGRRN